MEDYQNCRHKARAQVDHILASCIAEVFVLMYMTTISGWLHSSSVCIGMHGHNVSIDMFRWLFS